ncbi:hypothetical protein A2917_00750 [Candidatus Nomurabacteria bacterium RIFCSPLOWO2_01_FULL_42_17]|uniref:Serine protease n=1 Tax=Candidatus Nomurabacteria bacterium RIFCSPLOWO2_01_FULL_42_17 TaxID=1801780 RepID=A0A1F6XME6_9BACT|nr:MAG: hypothetical protein A2917_00750 [Candidatus Nomurabacteria bacterium RIFCSPLOWO2_01_FULL_42_17]
MKRLIDPKIYIPAVAALSGCALAALLYFGFQTFTNYKMQKEEAIQIQKEKERELELQKEQDSAARELKERLRDAELADLKQQLLDLQNKSSEVKTVTNTVEAKDTIVDIVKEWGPRVAHMECNWFYPNGVLFAKSTGSATIINFTNLGIRAVTSKHILAEKKNYAPNVCKILLADETEYSVLINENTVSVGPNEDWAYLTLPKDARLTSITKSTVKLCQNVEIGDKLLVLGYPIIGSKTGLTVTEGILSGFDRDYYITSAKIDKGNSGGAAVLIKNDCYLGIPTASVVGVIESLGRILKGSFVISN